MAALRAVAKFFNSAFGIWLLSSVIAAAILSIVSEEQRCYSTALTAIPKIAKSASERDLRIIEIAAILRSEKPEARVEEEIGSLVNGSTYFYREYKEKLCWT